MDLHLTDPNPLNVHLRVTGLKYPKKTLLKHLKYEK